MIPVSEGGEVRLDEQDGESCDIAFDADGATSRKLLRSVVGELVAGPTRH